MEENCDYEGLMYLIKLLLEGLTADLEKSYTVNLAAQRARVKTVELQKMFKVFRKESIRRFKERAYERS